MANPIGHSCITRSNNKCRATPSAQTKKVFIIGPSADEFSKDIEKVKQILKGFDLDGYVATQSESEAGEEVFCTKICSNIIESSFCIAILNDPIVHECSTEKKQIRAARPNVYYEYGIARAFNKKIIPIIRKDITLPFDIQHLQTIFYTNLLDLEAQLKPAVKGMIEKIAQERVNITLSTEENPLLNRLQTRRDIAMVSAISVVVIMFFLPFRLALFWIFNFGIDNWFNNQTLIYFGCLSFGFILLRLLFSESFYDKLIKTVKVFSLPFALSFIVFTALCSILTATIFWYPSSTSIFFESSWISFLYLTFLLTGISILVTFFAHFLITRYELTMADLAYEPKPKSEFVGFIHKIRAYKIKFTGKRVLISVILMLLITLSIVPSDIAFNIFTPSVSNGLESFSNDYPYDASSEIEVFIFSNWSRQTLFTTEYRFYKLAQTQYTLNPSVVPLSYNLTIKNPTMLSRLASGIPSSYSIWPDEYSYNISPIYLNVSSGVKYSIESNANNFTSVTLSIPAKSVNPLTVNFTYWTQLNANVSLSTYANAFVDLGNNTHQESYTYLITNNEDMPLSLRTLNFEMLNWADTVNYTSARILFNGVDIYKIYGFSEPRYIEMHRTLDLMHAYVEQGKTGNLTLTFEANDY